eukprot:g2318.t2
MCHAYQLLKRGGLSNDKIITFIFDDVAHDSKNPYRGRLYNKPGGRNVYRGCAKDYTGYDVNKGVFLAVLRGDSEAVRSVGSGRVLKKDPNQRVFFAYSDHGNPGIIAFPTGPFLYADELNRVVIEMKMNSMFSELLIYLESCYAGSMFTGMDIDKDDKVLAIAASAPDESSYATYCPYTSTTKHKSSISPEKIGTCMGDLFTVAWIEDTHTHNRYHTSVLDHLIRVATRTSAQDTYYYGSHVCLYGDSSKTIRHRSVGDFLASGKSTDNILNNEIAQSPNWTGTKQRDADLVYLYAQATSNNDSDAAEQLQKELEMRKSTDEAIYVSLEGLVLSGELPADVSVTQFAEDLISRRDSNEPIVKNWNCLREMVAAWEDKCGPLNTYAGQYTRTFVNLCNAAVSPYSFRKVLIC